MDSIETFHERLAVLVVDIRHSTTIVQRLKEHDLTGLWAALLVTIHENIEILWPDEDVLVYKFLGDGWLILIKKLDDGLLSRVASFLKTISETYTESFEERFEPLFEDDESLPLPQVSFGITVGNLTRFEFSGADEYIGKPINEAFRLQSEAAKNFETSEQFGYIDRAAYAEFREEIESSIEKEKLSLRGISTNESTYYKVPLSVFLDFYV